MEVNSVLVGDVVLCKPEGELTSRSELASVLWNHLHKGRNKFIINFEKVRAINSVGLSTLLEFKRLAEASGGEIKICGMCDNISRVFKASQLSEVFANYDDEELALAGFIKGLPLVRAESSVSRYRN